MHALRKGQTATDAYEYPTTHHVQANMPESLTRERFVGNGTVSANLKFHDSAAKVASTTGGTLLLSE